jgi:tRNA-splicing ligase RtcB
MGDMSVILRGIDSAEATGLLHSTVHGAGRVMSRMRAKKGRNAWVCRFGAAGSDPCAVRFEPPKIRPPKDMKCPIHHIALQKEQLEAPINFRDVQDQMKKDGIVLRGAGPDESPSVYRPLQSVLDAHAGSIEILQVLQPKIVVMAGEREHDPYKD